MYAVKKVTFTDGSAAFGGKRDMSEYKSLASGGEQFHITVCIQFLKG